MRPQGEWMGQVCILCIIIYINIYMFSMYIVHVHVQCTCAIMYTIYMYMYVRRWDGVIGMLIGILSFDICCNVQSIERMFSVTLLHSSY